VSRGRRQGREKFRQFFGVGAHLKKRRKRKKKILQREAMLKQRDRRRGRSAAVFLIVNIYEVFYLYSIQPVSKDNS
jgi:hypothetical protein